MKRMRQKKRNWMFLGTLLLTLMVWLLPLIGYYYSNANDEFYVSTDDINKTIFPEQANTTELDASSGNRTVHLYVDTSVAMRGLVYRDRGTCLSSTYTDMLNRLIASLASWTVEINEFYGNHIYALSRPDALLTENAYSHETGAGSSLLEVLATAQQSDAPCIIITELESHTTALASQTTALKSAFKGIFDAGKSICISRYVTSYSGILYDYAGSGINYSYGLKNAQSSAPQLQAGTQYGHHLPRAFYTLIIADHGDSATLEQLLSNTYKSASENVSIAESASEHNNPDRSLYRGQANYMLATPQVAVLSRYSEGDVSPDRPGIHVDANGLTNLTERLGLNADNTVYRFELPHVQSAGALHRLTFTITPSYSVGNLTAILKDNVSCEKAMYRMVMTHSARTDEIGDPLPSNYLAARGDRLLQLTTQAAGDNSLTADCKLLDNGQIELTVDVNQGMLEEGMYRVRIQVYATQDSRAIVRSISPSLDPYSITAYDAQDQVRALIGHTETDIGNNPVIKTVDLQSFLEQMREGYCEFGQGLELADIMFELNIT